jgi:sensor domain CHASE-containing protein
MQYLPTSNTIKTNRSCRNLRYFFLNILVCILHTFNSLQKKVQGHLQGQVSEQIIIVFEKAVHWMNMVLPVSYLTYI